MDEKTLSLIRLLIARLERISADSVWAHRASGVKGSLLKTLEKFEEGETEQAHEVMQTVDMGFSILEKAAKEKGRLSN
jgi:hypothetical protein